MPISVARLRQMFPGCNAEFLKLNATIGFPAKKNDSRTILEPMEGITGGLVSFRINVTPRSVQFGKRMGINKKTGKMLMFCDSKTKKFYEEVTLAASEFAPPMPLEGPLRVTMELFFPRPQRLMTKKSPDEPIWMPSRPDAENCFKGIADPLTRLNFWLDDAQIVHQEALKRYCAKDDVAHIVIHIAEL